MATETTENLAPAAAAAPATDAAAPAAPKKRRGRAPGSKNKPKTAAKKAAAKKAPAKKAPAKKAAKKAVVRVAAADSPTVRGPRDQDLARTARLRAAITAYLRNPPPNLQPIVSDMLKDARIQAVLTDIKHPGQALQQQLRQLETNKMVKVIGKKGLARIFELTVKGGAKPMGPIKPPEDGRGWVADVDGAFPSFFGPGAAAQSKVRELNDFVKKTLGNKPPVPGSKEEKIFKKLFEAVMGDARAGTDDADISHFLPKGSLNRSGAAAFFPPEPATSPDLKVDIIKSTGRVRLEVRGFVIEIGVKD